MRHITINGFKSIRRMEKLELSNLNVIIGANGAGKSNFIQVFKLFSSMIYGGLSQFILSRGGADGFLYNGPKETSKIQIEVELEPQKGSSVVIQHNRDTTFLSFPYTHRDNIQYAFFSFAPFVYQNTHRAKEKT